MCRTLKAVTPVARVAWYRQFRKIVPMFAVLPIELQLFVKYFRKESSAR